MENMLNYIRTIPDFPKKGILFYDISPLLANPFVWKQSILELTKICIHHKPDYIVGIESRGFLLAAPLAYELNMGFVLIRKKGKLPGDVARYAYNLEYGDNVIEMQKDLIPAGKKVFVVDDVLATGGTLKAATQLLEKLHLSITGIGCLLELKALNGRKHLTQYPLTSLITV